MDGPAVKQWLLELCGTGLIALSMTDVFMTVFYARAGTGPLSHRVCGGCWGIARRLARCMGRFGDTFLTYFGPGILVFLMSLWIGLLLLGFTFIAWPNLGSGIMSQSGHTSGDFLTAFYYAGGSITTLGSGDIRPVTGLFKFLSVIDSIMGMSVLTLSLSYIIQVYTALHSRNALVLGMHHASQGTGDAAVTLGGLGSGDDFSHATSMIATFAGSVSSVYESHHFYSVLIYFRFREAYYAMARAALVAMEFVTLAETALDDRRHGWLKGSASIAQIRESTMQTLTELAKVYLPGGLPPVGDQDEVITRRWRARYHGAVDRLRRLGISVVRDEAQQAERYVQMRRQWDSYVMAFAKYMEHRLEEIDPFGTDPAMSTARRELPTPPLRKVG
jgi:hypothetical protein